MHSPAIHRLIQILSRLPGLGPRSGRRLALYLIQNKKTILEPLMGAIGHVKETIKSCQECGNLDTSETCSICVEPSRDKTTLCILAGVDDLWALERAGAYKGVYHVLGGVLSALDGMGPEQLRLKELGTRIAAQKPQEVIIALSATLEGQTTAHYVADMLRPHGITVTKLAHGVPVGGELDYLDEGTIAAALQARRPF